MLIAAPDFKAAFHQLFQRRLVSGANRLPALKGGRVPFGYYGSSILKIIAPSKAPPLSAGEMRERWTPAGAQLACSAHLSAVANVEVAVELQP